MERAKLNIHMLVNKIKDTESAFWYNNKKEYGRMANMKPPNTASPVT